MIGRVVWIDYTEIVQHGLVARVGLRLENGERKNCYFKDINPWGFVRENEELPERDWIVDIESGYESIFNDSLKKVITTSPDKVNSRSDGDVLTNYVSGSFESDIPMYRKLSMVDGISGYIEIPDEPLDSYYDIDVYSFDDVNVDAEYEGEIQPRVMISDIEVRIGDESFEKTRENASQPINVICSYDSHKEDYSVFFYNKYNSIESPGRIREIVKEQWDGDEIYHEADIELRSSETEADMLNDFINYTINRQFDLTSGWNWIDFDYNYIINRCDVVDDVDKTNLSPFGSVGYTSNDQMQICGLPSIDMMRAFCDKMTFSNWRSKSLDYVSNEEIGVGKIDDVDINQDWKHNPEKLIGYNIVDVMLTVELDRVNDIHEFFYDIADISSIPIYDTFYEKRIVDGYIISRRKEDEILPSVTEKETPNAGGYVDNAVNGRKKNVGVSDLKSLYPSAMITGNISTETISDTPEDFDEYVKIPHVPEPKKVEGDIEEDQIDWDWLYCSLEKEGIIPRTLKTLFKKRNREKQKMYAAETDAEEAKWDRKQGATKVIMNSFYGNASSPYWRMSNEFLGDAITSFARYTLWKGRVSIESIGYEAVYGDTDSHFIQLKENELDAQIEELKRISSKMDEDASEIAQDIGIEGKHPFLIDAGLHGDEYTCMVWEPEKIYKVWMQLGKKKRYAGNIDWKEGTKYPEPNTSISGFENQRSDSMEITAELQEKIIEMILTDNDFESVSEYIQSIIDEIDRDNPDVKKFALPGSINKDLEDYPNRQVPRACMWSNEHLDMEFVEGDDPFVYLVSDSPSGMPQTDVVALEWNDDIPEGFELDDEAIIERGIRKPIAPIIEEVDWEFNELRSGKRQQKKDLSTGGSNPFK